MRPVVKNNRFGASPAKRRGRDSANRQGNDTRRPADIAIGSCGGSVENRSIGELVARVRGWFPDREFFMRSNGHVRFIRVSQRLQMTAAAGIGLLALGWVITIASVAIHRLAEMADTQSLLNREARVESAEQRVTTYRRSLNGVADDLRRRQDFIETMVRAHLGEMPQEAHAGDTVSDSSKEAGRTVAKVSVAIPEAAALARQEVRQLAFVEMLTRYADHRAEADATHMRHLGLNPEVMLAHLDGGRAMGGPLLPLTTSANGTLDPRFERLGLSLARMSALENGLHRLPQVLPARLEYISSGFGFRSDPFTHTGAFHPGLDFRGPVGAPIFAAARGFVSFAGRKSGYGNCVEVSHGDGVVTRYAHMSAFRAHVGQQVAAGQTIGAIGSTGRSTGPHLHFEVRINDRPVNPRPFLETSAHVSQNFGSSAAADD